MSNNLQLYNQDLAKNLNILLVLSSASRAITDFIFISCIGVEEKVTLEYIYRTEGCFLDLCKVLLFRINH